MYRLGTSLLTIWVLSFAFPGWAQARQGVCCAEEGLAIAARYRVAEISERRFTHDDLWQSLEGILESPALSVQSIGRSVHGRDIKAVTFGEGPVKVLLWSQMHGNESTATMALADIIRFFAEAEDDPIRNAVALTLSVTMVPMLNPDGAEVFQRENAVGVDINRDARRLATPEARALKGLRDRLEPDFGFNLHDQGARTLVGPGGQQVAIALLAPAASEDRSYGPTRRRAQRLAAYLAAVLDEIIPGRVAKYGDEFNPRAFGDLMQAWGTSTVLIESGAMEDDPQKQELRAVNVAVILSALNSIGTGSYRQANGERYNQLLFNHRIGSDLLILGGQVVMDGSDPMALDIAIQYDDPVAKTGPRIVEVGDLAGAVSLDTLSIEGQYIHPEHTTPDGSNDLTWLKRDVPAQFVIRTGDRANSREVRRFGSAR